MKLTNNLTIESQMQAHRAQGFTPVQLDQILLGLECNVDVSIYAFPQYPGVLMQLSYEVMMFDDDFDISKFSTNGKLSVEHLLTYHDSLSCRYRMLSRFSDVAREHILRNAPYYTSYESSQPTFKRISAVSSGLLILFHILISKQSSNASDRLVRHSSADLCLALYTTGANHET